MSDFYFRKSSDKIRAVDKIIECFSKSPYEFIQADKDINDKFVCIFDKFNVCVVDENTVLVYDKFLSINKPLTKKEFLKIKSALNMFFDGVSHEKYNEI